MKPTIGIIGVGVMGLAMSQRLLNLGYSVLVHDIDPARVVLAKSAGALIAINANQIAQQADVILVVVLNADQIKAVLEPTSNTDSGLLRGLILSPKVNSGCCPTVLLCSTIAPADVDSFCAQIQSAGAWVLDAPVSGGPVRAAVGSISVMLAGSSVAISSVQAVLNDLSNKQFIVSTQTGDAMRAKLVNNLMAASHLVASAQAMNLASAMGLDLVKMAQITSASSGQSWICDDRIPRALMDDYEPRAQLHVLTKDVCLACDAARELAVPLPAGEHAAQVMQAACDAGHQAQDDAILFQHWARVSSV
jgi:L-threonate 2-dehydrogenase